MTRFTDKLSSHIKKKGLSPYVLAREGKIDSGLLYRVLNGERKPSDGILRKLAEVPALEIDYPTLHSWKGLDEYPELREEFPRASNVERQTAPVVSLPVLGTVAAGGLTWAEQTELGTTLWGEAAPPPKGTFALKVVGNSMNPPYPNGALIYVVSAERFESGRDYVVETANGETTFKAVLVSQDGLKLIPKNTEHQVIKVADVDITRAWEVLGYSVMNRRV